jgi:hypothetical protein
VTRMISAVFVALVAFAAVFAVSMSATTAGLVPDDAVTLWASAITAGDGQMPIGRIVAAYPTIPFLAATLLEFVTPAGTPTPVLLTAGVLALLAGGLFVSFRRTGVPPIGGTLMVFLIVLHPAVLRAAIAGPADIIFTVFLFLLGGALFDLRARSAAPEVMAVALSLLGLAFSHPMGAAIACAAIPLFVFSVRPELLTSLTLNLVMTLGVPDCVLRCRILLHVMGISRQRLELPDRTGRRCRHLGSGLFEPVRPRPDWVAGTRCRNRSACDFVARSAPRPLLDHLGLGTYAAPRARTGDCCNDGDGGQPRGAYRAVWRPCPTRGNAPHSRCDPHHACAAGA